MTLTAKIESAFAAVPRPGEFNVFEWDCEGADVEFVGKDWREISHETLDYNSFALRCFSPEGFHHYLPAFMIAALENPALGIVDNVLVCLTPPKSNVNRPNFYRRWKCLSSKQRSSVVEFVNHFEHLNPLQLAALASSLEASIDSSPFTDGEIVG